MSGDADDMAMRDISAGDLMSNGTAKGASLGADLPPGAAGRKKVVHLRKVG
jgi:hypothetical protein